MGIHLDWEVESDVGTASVEEDAAVIAARQRKNRNLRRLLVGTAVFLALIGTGAVWRLHQVGKLQRTALEAVVDAETLALRLGDERAFLSTQGPAKEWRTEQTRRFRKMQTFRESVAVTGEILDVRMDQDEAQVTVRVSVGGQPDNAVWLYQYTDRGWRHVETVSEPWTRQNRPVGEITLSYYLPDQAAADLAETYFTGQWAKLREATGMAVGPEITIIIDGEAKSLRWYDRAHTTLLIPPDAIPSSVFELESESITHFIADLWTRHLLQGVQGDDWLSDHLNQWLREQMIPPARDSSTLFESLNKAFGPSFTPTFIAEMHHPGHTTEHAITDAMRAGEPPTQQGEALNAYLGNFLMAEIIYESQNPDVPASDMPFVDRERAIQTDGFFTNLKYYGTNPPQSITVTETRHVGDILWARAHLVYESPWGDSSPGETTTLDVYVPFRNVDGYWVHTRAFPSDWGKERIQRGDWVTIKYHELDAPEIDGMNDYLAKIYLQAARDFGLPEADTVPLTIQIVPDSVGMSWNRMPGRLPVLTITSAYGTCCLDAHSAPEFQRSLAAQMIVSAIYARRVGDIDPYPAQTMREVALLRWEADQLGITSYHYTSGINLTQDSSWPSLLVDLWQQDMSWDNPRDRYYAYASVLGMDVLFDLITERYGEDAVGRLIPRMRIAAGMDDWLYQAIGVHANEIQSDWLAAYAARLTEQNYRLTP